MVAESGETGVSDTKTEGAPESAAPDLGATLTGILDALDRSPWGTVVPPLLLVLFTFVLQANAAGAFFVGDDFEYLNRMLSFDPTQRGWMEDRESYIPPVELGEVMRASGVGEVVGSNHPDFAEGDLVQGLLGWQDYCATTATGPSVGLT